jgi:hypothetical protein
MLIRVSKVMGMGTELSLVLGIMGTVWTGNPLSLNPGFSIGGPSASSDLLGSLTGFLTGMSSSQFLHATSYSLCRRQNSWSSRSPQLARIRRLHDA